MKRCRCDDVRCTKDECEHKLCISKQSEYQQRVNRQKLRWIWRFCFGYMSTSKRVGRVTHRLNEMSCNIKRVSEFSYKVALEYWQSHCLREVRRVCHPWWCSPKIRPPSMTTVTPCHSVSLLVPLVPSFVCKFSVFLMCYDRCHVVHDNHGPTPALCCGGAVLRAILLSAAMSELWCGSRGFRSKFKGCKGCEQLALAKHSTRCPLTPR